jgi:hypothetical protein
MPIIPYLDGFKELVERELSKFRAAFDERFGPSQST